MKKNQLMALDKIAAQALHKKNPEELKQSVLAVAGQNRSSRRAGLRVTKKYKK